MKAYSSPLISVVIPTFNRAHCILKAIDTAAAQTYSNIEIIVVDDGSTDETLRLLLEKQKTEPRLRVIAQENGGVSAARNRGIALSRGDYIAFLDSDDLWAPEKLVKQYEEIKALSKDSLALCTTDVMVHDMNGRWSKRTSYDPRYINREFTPFYPSALLVTKASFKKGGAGLFDETLFCAEDHDWEIRFKKAGGIMRVSPSPDVDYVFNEGAQYKNMGASLKVLFDKHGDWLALNARDFLEGFVGKMERRTFEGKNVLLKQVRSILGKGRRPERSPAPSLSQNAPKF